jgi:hypothetical protein
VNQNCMSKVLLFHIFPINNWQEVTARLLAFVPHDDIFVHVSLNQDEDIMRDHVSSFLQSFGKIRSIFFSQNTAHAEVDAMAIFRAKIDLSQYSLFTYMHAKGVTRPNDQNILDWVELLRYFIIDRMDLTLRAFERGYVMYGVNKTAVADDDWDFRGARFFYAGNFVTVSLRDGMLGKVNNTALENEYYGLEGFWGKLCPDAAAYNAFHSRINHYLTPFPGKFYKNWFGRRRYVIVSYLYHHFYSLRRQIAKAGEGTPDKP